MTFEYTVRAMENKMVVERWAAKLKSGELVWNDITSTGPNRYHYEWSDDNSSIILSGRPAPKREIKSIGALELEGMRSFIRKHAHPAGEVVAWYGPVPSNKPYQTLKEADLEGYAYIGDINLAFRLEYKDRVYDQKAATESAMSFVHDAILACSDPSCEPIQQIQVTITINNPTQEKTRLVLAREGNGWEEHERGFQKG
jgi:hypothetical protein